MAQHPTRSLFITGLKNAHAMENQALSIMKPQVSRIENYPEVRERLEQHIRETEAQLQRLDALLQGQDTSNSTLKDWALSIVGGVAALGHTVAPDEIIKNSFANFAFENFEIAAYKSLLVLADLTGETGAQTVLRQNLDEEVAMANWLDESLASVTTKFAQLSAAGETAKV